MPAETIARTRDSERPRAFELDDVGAGFLDEPDRVANGVFVGHVVAPERHVADDERSLDCARHGARQEEHLVHRHRDGPVVAEHDHAGGVTDEQDVDAGLFRKARAGRVVGGDHHDLLAAALQVGEVRQRQLPGFHLRSPSRTTLSIKSRRADPRGGGEERDAVEVEQLDVLGLEAVECARVPQPRGRSPAACAERPASSARGSASAWLSLLIREIGVARRQGQAVLVADGRQHAQVEHRGPGRGSCGEGPQPAGRPSGRSTRRAGARC